MEAEPKQTAPAPLSSTRGLNRLSTVTTVIRRHRGCDSGEALGPLGQTVLPGTDVALDDERRGDHDPEGRGAVRPHFPFRVLRPPDDKHRHDGEEQDDGALELHSVVSASSVNLPDMSQTTVDRTRVGMLHVAGQR